MLQQLSKCFASAHLSIDYLINKGYIPFKIDGYHVGWVSPQAWVALAQFKHIFQFSNGSVNIAVATYDLNTRNHFISKVLNILAKKQWLLPLKEKEFDVISPLNQKLCSIDVSGALFFGLELPVISITAFFKQNNQYYYWISQDSNTSFNLLFQEVLDSNVSIASIVNNACISLGISSGVAHTIGCIATKRLTKEGLLRCRMQNYIIEVPEHLDLSAFSNTSKVASTQDIIHLLSIPNYFSVEANVILADILQQHGIIEILPNGISLL
ncbi:MAG: hypothetical protein RLZZ210_689 [Pseudomonadota bacterium]|jgi:hypothetical protein